MAAELDARDDASTLQILGLWSERGKFCSLLDEVARLLHNFLASAMTLVDHTRAHINTRHAGTAFEKEYQQHIRESFTANPVSRFVQCLRNYNLHYSLPVVSGRLSMEFDPPGQTKSMKSQFMLNVLKLQEWDNWDPPSKTYITRVGEELPVDRLADDYMKLVLPFHDWFRERDLAEHYPHIRRAPRKTPSGGR